MSDDSPDTYVPANRRKRRRTGSWSDGANDSACLNDACRYERCEHCTKAYSPDGVCDRCDGDKLAQPFKLWTNSDKNAVEIVPKSQANAWSDTSHIEWILPWQIGNIEHLADGGFGAIYCARWHVLG